MAFWYDLAVSQGTPVGRYQRMITSLVTLQAAVEKRLSDKYGPGGFIKRTARSMDPGAYGSNWSGMWGILRDTLLSVRLSTLDNFVKRKAQEWATPEQVDAICGPIPPDGSSMWAGALSRTYQPESARSTEGLPGGLLTSLLCYGSPDYSADDRSLIDAWDAWRNGFLEKFGDYVGDNDTISRVLLTSSAAQNDQSIAYDLELRKWIAKLQSQFGVNYQAPALATDAESEAQKPKFPWLSIAVLVAAAGTVWWLTRKPNVKDRLLLPKKGEGAPKEPIEGESEARADDKKAERAKTGAEAKKSWPWTRKVS